MPKCNEIEPVKIPQQKIEGFGKDENASLMDLQNNLEKRCGEERAKKHIPCSTGEGCENKEVCSDEASMAGNVETKVNPGGDPDKKYVSIFVGDITCKCHCKKKVEDSNNGRIERRPR